MGTFFYSAFVAPIELLVELLFVFFYKSFNNIGLSIAAISILVNIFALPLYYIADKLQKTERDTRIGMQPGIARIKSVFKGDEQYLVLSTFYRQNHYHPSYALRSSVSLLIQVPFFIAAYHFLSHLPQLQGERFLLIKDLGQPDGLLSLGGVTINVLPLMMTAINLVAGAIYTKGFPLKDKVQLYGMAGLFLVLLYQSPAGLVYYWTLNNLFSLGKNLFYRMKHPLKIFYICTSVSAMMITIVILKIHPTLSFANRCILFATCFAICLIPLLLKFANLLYVRYLDLFLQNRRQVFSLFVLSCFLLWAICGILVPANLINSSPIEFSFTGTVDNPLFYIFANASIFLGIWLVWPSFFYALANQKMRAIFSFSFLVLSFSGVLNLFVFNGTYGTINKLLLFDNPSLLDASTSMVIVPIFAILLLASLSLSLLRRKFAGYLTALLLIFVLASSFSGVFSMMHIHKEFKTYKVNLSQTEGGLEELTEITPVIHLSREGQNVVVLMLDRAISSYFPFIMDQFPQLETTFSGFTYYPNTVSFGSNTIMGAPALMGGYEYTLDAINARNTEKLVDKHNEAALVLPRMFLEAGFNVSVIDPPYANYKWEADFTAFKPYPDIKVLKLDGKYSMFYKMEHQDVLDWNPEYESTTIKHRMPIFTLLKMLPPLMRKTLYDAGDYFLMQESAQTTDSFIESYANLYYLQGLTDYEATGNTFTFMCNDTTHKPVFLQAPEYEPRTLVTDSFTPFDTRSDYSDYTRASYHANAAAVLRVGRWLDSLKEAGVYDNTRIIIVADHGMDYPTPAFIDFEQNQTVLGFYNPLLLVKDFDSEGVVQEDLRFMTNADTPVFAVQDLLSTQENPFTGNNLNEMIDKENVNCYSGQWDPRKNLGTTFVVDSSRSFSVHDSIFEESNWTPILDTSK